LSGVLCLTAAIVGSMMRPTAAFAAGPSRLSIYYGYPSLVNGAAGNLERALAAFSEFDVIVLGDGLQRPSTTSAPGHPDHAFTRRLIASLKRTARAPQVFGYVDLGNSQRLPMTEIVLRLGQWRDMGAAGVFFDEAGYDYGVRRERQNDAVLAARAVGLRVFLNAYRPDDVFAATPVPLNAAGGGNPNGVAPMVGATDVYLLESFAVKNGQPETPAALAERASAALAGRAKFRTQVMSVALGEDSPRNDALASYAWWASALFGLDGHGWSEQNYGATTSRTTQRRPPDAEARLRDATYVGTPHLLQPLWRRVTSVGTIVLDSIARTGALAPQ